ncbi:hypothetical protein J6590_034737 [Homalodisca vitripennis]|nr:hypothetical protein J6590_034737 [Homalodisca vitripennis]
MCPNGRLEGGTPASALAPSLEPRRVPTHQSPHSPRVDSGLHVPPSAPPPSSPPCVNPRRLAIGWWTLANRRVSLTPGLAGASGEASVLSR